MLARSLTKAVAVASSTVLVLGLVMPTNTVFSSSHREAPYISTDQQADASDVYAFVSPDDPTTVTLIVNYVPLQVPSGGPNYYKFGDDVLYEINIDNDGDALEELSFQFRFSTEVNNEAFGLGTFLHNSGPVDSLDSPNLLQKQFYEVGVFTGNSFSRTRVPSETYATDANGRRLQVAPANVGPATFPPLDQNGNVVPAATATRFDRDRGYRSVAQQAYHTVQHSSGKNFKVFAGPRDDAFFISLGEAFDLLNFKSLGKDSQTTKDDVAGLNVHTIAIQMPTELLTANGQPAVDPNDTNSVIGVRTTSYRQSRSVFRPGFGPKETSDTSFSRAKFNAGGWIQVNRLDLPLINELIIGLKDKDRFNASRPRFDGQFLSYVTNVQLAAILNLVFGTSFPDGSTPQTTRNDLVELLLLGVPDVVNNGNRVNRPDNVVASSQLRLNMAIPPTPRNDQNFSRLGLIGGNLDGFPNGRRLEDDVVDIETQVVAGALFNAFAPAYNQPLLDQGVVDFITGAPGSPTEALGGLSDGIDVNDLPFLPSFPYVWEPTSYPDFDSRVGF